MKHFAKILLLALSLGAITAALVIFVKSKQIDDKDDLAWIKIQFNLDQEHLNRVRKLHDDYMSKCTEMCVKIENSNSKLRSLVANNSQVTPEIESAIKECATVQTECHASMLEYFYSVSKEMKPEDAKVYMNEMMKCIVQPASRPGLR